MQRPTEHNAVDHFEPPPDDPESNSMTSLARLLSAAFLILTCLACQPTEQATSESMPENEGPVELATALPPLADANIIVVSFDALRADALGVYGYGRDTSPNIDRWAEQAVVFDHAYSAAPVTPTSFAAAFTAQLPFRTFKEWNLVPTRTLAGALSDAGYTSVGMINNSQITEERHFDQGFSELQAFDAISDDEMLERGTRWLIENRDERFFLWLHFLSPHSPYDYRAQSSQFYDSNYSGEFKTTSTSKFETEDPTEVQRIRDLYDGEVYYADQLFGQLRDFLQEQGLLDSSILILTADHGEEFKERGGFQHRYLYEETVRIPLIIQHPQTDGGVRSQTFYSNVDLWPTLAAMVGATPPETSDGWNLLQPTQVDRAFVSVAMTDRKYRGMNLRQGDEKLILTCIPEMRAELYNLADDPEERHDLATGETGRVRDLLQMLRLISGADEPCQAIEDALAGKDQTEGLSPETIEGLRALGYIQ